MFTKIITVILVAMLMPIMYVCFVPYVLFKGFTDEIIINRYLNVWDRILDTLLYPVFRLNKYREQSKTLLDKIEYYKKRVETLEAELENKIKTDK